MKKPVIAAVVAMFLCSIGVYAAIEDKDKTVVTFQEVVERVRDVSDAYVKAILMKQNNGNFSLDPKDLEQLRAQLDQLNTKLANLPVDGPIFEPKFKEEDNRKAFDDALQCLHCVGVSKEGQTKTVSTKAELQRLLISRCQDITKPVSNSIKTGNVSFDTFFALEVHLSYLRQISVAYYNLV